MKDARAFWQHQGKVSTEYFTCTTIRKIIGSSRDMKWKSFSTMFILFSVGSTLKRPIDHQTLQTSSQKFLISLFGWFHIKTSHWSPISPNKKSKIFNLPFHYCTKYLLHSYCLGEFFFIGLLDLKNAVIPLKKKKKLALIKEHLI